MGINTRRGTRTRRGEGTNGRDQDNGVNNTAASQLVVYSRGLRSSRDRGQGGVRQNGGAGAAAAAGGGSGSSSGTSSKPGKRPAAPSTFPEALERLRQPLAPLVQATSGRVHPRFPRTLLGFSLLTDAELESLARFYHQAPVSPFPSSSGGAPSRRKRPHPWASRYPCPVRWDPGADVQIKRRRFGRFIGLRGCESPVSQGPEEGNWREGPEGTGFGVPGAV